jgi:BirA family biotin operon repressor/biotin-[acetyl-CoA-carboxylase] ligase
MNDFLKSDENHIKLNLETEFMGKPLYIFDTVSSTFDKIAEFPRTEGLTVIAHRQTNGRGRLGRSWSSDEGGIYMSFNLTPSLSPKDASELTIPCALGVAKALRRYGDCKIKWPNDIVLNGKKICGILSTMGISDGKTDYVCVGIGINTNQTEFSDLPNASSIRILTGNMCNENQIICDILKNIEKEYISDKKSVLEQYKNYCLTLGSTVTVHYCDDREDFQGECIDITESGLLVVKNDDNTIYVSSGEVSVRGLYGYV